MTTIGPIDPQVIGKEGRYVPAQELMNLFNRIGKEGQNFLDKDRKIPWHLIRLLDNIDPRLVGEAMSLSNHSISIAAEFLEKYKFRHWKKHSTTQKGVTDQERKQKSVEIANNLCSNEKWRTHSFRITRDLAEDKEKLGIRIKHPETNSEFHRALRRFWALMSEEG